MSFTPTFVLLQQEAYLACGCLSAGLTALRNAAFPDNALFYSGFFNTSIALERVMKLIVVIDHMLQHGGKPPSIKELKDYGHDLSSLYRSSIKASIRIGMPCCVLRPDSLEMRILLFLSEFSTASRYYNLNALLSVPSSHAEPLGVWSSIIDEVLVQDVPPKKLLASLAHAHMLHELVVDSTFAIQHGMNGELLNLSQVFSIPVKHELAAPYAMVRLFNIINPLLRTAGELGRIAYYGPPRPPTPLAPLLHEFFVDFTGSNADIRRKKRWP